MLTRASATFAPFTIERHCMAQDVTRFHSAAGRAPLADHILYGG